MNKIIVTYTKFILDGHLRGMTIPGNTTVYPAEESNNVEYHFEYMVTEETVCKDLLGNRFRITEFSIENGG